MINLDGYSTFLDLKIFKYAYKEKMLAEKTYFYRKVFK